MLIKALCDYYDILSEEGKVLPNGYSNVKIHYLISLTSEGKIDGILDWQEKKNEQIGKNKQKEKKSPRDMIMPQRTEKPGIDPNIADHRPLYLFGLNLTEDGFTPDDRTDKARKSHQAFVEANLSFTEGLDSPVVQAFRNFLQSWKPDEERENPYLLGLKKDYSKSGYAFCLSGNPDLLLHDDPQFKGKWETEYQKQQGEDLLFSQCAVTGEKKAIARIHNKIKGVYGGHATGSVLIGFNNPSENSYGNEQSYNSNISEEAMKKYTEALNYLLGSGDHKIMLDEMTVVFWAMNRGEKCEDMLLQAMFGETGNRNQQDAEQTEKMLKKMMEESGELAVSEQRLAVTEFIDLNVDFYMLGLKPNSSRLSIKFIFRRKFADVLWNIARFQRDMQMGTDTGLIPLWQIKKELVSPKSSNEKASPALLSQLLKSVLSGDGYPSALLETMVRRVRIDGGEEKINRIRAGVIKAWVNRDSKKEELKLALDKENTNQAYLCGRLFAVLEKIQQEASGNGLNRTIKDAYFASASVKPAQIFPKLIRLSQNHIKKIKYVGFYNKLMEEIIGNLNGEFPEFLRLAEQGRFIVGYYQQFQDLYVKKEKEDE